MERERRGEGGSGDELGARGGATPSSSSQVRGKPTTRSGGGEGRTWLGVGLGAVAARVSPIAPGRSAGVPPREVFFGSLFLLA